MIYEATYFAFLQDPLAKLGIKVCPTGCWTIGVGGSCCWFCNNWTLPSL